MCNTCVLCQTTNKGSGDVGSQLNTSKQCIHVAEVANGTLACFRNSTARRSREVIILLYAALVKLHLELNIYCVWVPHCKKDIETCTKMTREGQWSHEVFGAQVLKGAAGGAGTVYSGERSPREYLITVYNCLKGGCAGPLLPQNYRSDKRQLP